MIITLPHLGPLWISAAQFLKYNDLPFILPSENGQRALCEGSKISPEEICLPFKYMAGNFIDAYERGADTAVMISTKGPCRLGEYGELLKVVLKNAGYEYKWVIIESFGLSQLKKLYRDTDGKSLKATRTMRMFIGLLLSTALIFDIDIFERKVLSKSAYLLDHFGPCNLLKETRIKLQNAESYKEAFAVIRNGKKMFRLYKKNKKANPVKVYITGEIYTSIEAEANGHIEEILIMQGCSVRRHIDISWWIIHSIKRRVFPKALYNRLDKTRPVTNNVGGYARESAYEINKNRWADGIIKIMPSGCMPEIVTKAYCEGFCDKNVLHLIYDEMKEDTGYITRIEAFVDMLERKKNVLAGNRHRIHKHRLGDNR